MAKEYNQFTSEDDILVINAKLKNEEYQGLSDDEILVKLNKVGIYIMKPWEVKNGKVVKNKG